MVLPGLRYKSDPRETMAHYTAVAKAGGLPVMIYNNPLAYGVDITPAMFAEMAAEPLFAAVKESLRRHPPRDRTHQSAGRPLSRFSPASTISRWKALRWARSAGSPASASRSQENVAIYELSKAGRFEEARAIYRWIGPLDIDVSTKLVQNIKLAEAIAIGSNDRCRPPRLPLAGAERARIAAIVERNSRRPNCRPAHGGGVNALTHSLQITPEQILRENAT